MEFRLLGPLEVVGDDGAPVDIPGTRLRLLLAVLLVHANEVVPVDRLADALWGDSPPAGVTNALQKLVSNLRRVLPDRITWTGSGYRFEIAADELDIARFEALLAKDAPRDALALWRGPALGEFVDEEFARGEAVRLSEMRVVAIEDGIDRELESGRAADLVGELQALIVEFPLRERLRGQLMLALYRAGRQADALRAFQDARDTLVDELGIEPGRELRDLEAAILEQDLALATRPAAAAPERPRTNLRAPLTSLVGRADELRAISAAARDEPDRHARRPGRLGEDASRARGRPPRRPRVAGRRVARGTRAGRAFRSRARDRGRARDPRRPHARRRERRARTHRRLPRGRGRSCSCSTIANTSSAKPPASRWRSQRACPDVRILATSREGLGVPGEHLVAVPPLPPDDALQLFVERANSFDELELDASTRATAAEVCARLDGLPLAIELAAARTRVLSIEDISARLDQRFRLLTGGPRTALPRQQTLRAVVDWSYDLLFDDERRVFERLSVFASGCSLAGAEHVCSDDDIPVEDIADIVARLVDKSLVASVRVDGQPRFTMLQTLVQYGREHLAATGAADEVRRRQAEFVAGLARRGPAAFRGEHQDAWLAEVRREQENTALALEWSIEHGDADLACEIAGGVAWAWWMSGQARDGVAWLERAPRAPRVVGCDAARPCADVARVAGRRGRLRGRLRRSRRRDGRSPAPGRRP